MFANVFRSMWYFDVRMKIQSERTTYSLSPIILSLFSLTLIQKQLPFLQEKKWHQHRSLKELSSPATELDRRHEASPVPREGFPRPMPIFSLSLSLAAAIEIEVGEIYDRFQLSGAVKEAFRLDSGFNL